MPRPASSLIYWVGAALALFVAGTGGCPSFAQSPLECEKLYGHVVAPDLIGLPSGGAHVNSATLERLSGSPAEPGQSVPYCKVLGEIAPRGPKAPPIQFEVNLPEKWNGKAVAYGGGGFNGVLVTGLDQLRNAPLGTPVPVARGYVTWGTDSGHDKKALPEQYVFALNEEALENFAFASYKKVRDVAVEIVRMRYGTPPRLIYFFGESEGGREGLAMAQRFPADFDGIVSLSPLLNWVARQTTGALNGVAMMGDGWLDGAKVKTLHQAVLDACDAMDGLSDGIVSRYSACLPAFDPKKLRCQGGRDDADNCFSDAEIASVERIHQRYVFPFTLANGGTSYPPYNYGGEDQHHGFRAWQSGRKPPTYPLGPTARMQGYAWYSAVGAVRYFLAGNAGVDPRKFRPEDFKARIEQISALMDTTDPDLSRFSAHGGKLIVKQNMADYALSPFATIEYYDSVVAKLGQANVDAFMRFYVTPGANHGGIGASLDGAPLPGRIDLLEVIDAWVDRKTPPGDLVQIAQAPDPPFATTASRPMCRYPAWPRYKGAGSPKGATSFVCFKDPD